jgi:hypothetical protein
MTRELLYVRQATGKNISSEQRSRLVNSVEPANFFFFSWLGGPPPLGGFGGFSASNPWQSTISNFEVTSVKSWDIMCINIYCCVPKKTEERGIDSGNRKQ